MQPPPQWTEDRQTFLFVIPDLRLFDGNRLAKKGAIWYWVSGTPALRLGLNGIAPFESFWWPTAAESAGCPACFKAYYVPEIEQNSELITRAHTRAHTLHLRYWLDLRRLTGNSLEVGGPALTKSLSMKAIWKQQSIRSVHTHITLHFQTFAVMFFPPADLSRTSSQKNTTVKVKHIGMIHSHTISRIHSLKYSWSPANIKAKHLWICLEIMIFLST